MVEAGRAHVELLETGKPLLQALQRRTRFGLPVADILALAAVDDHSHDALQRFALLVEQNRVEQGGGKGCQRCKAEDRAALGKPQADQRQDQKRHEHGCEQRPRQQGLERLGQ